MALLAPSVLAADFLHLERDILWANEHADILHLDVMDGIFVPNISFGVPVVQAISTLSTIPLDVHLMIVRPDRYIPVFAKAGASMISFHLEAALDSGISADSTLDQIHSLGLKAGIAIDPDVPVADLFPYIGKADYFLIMSVFAGFGGQKFIPATLDRIATMREELKRKGNCSTLIEIDGGVNRENASSIARGGADILVAGSAVFGSPYRDEVVEAVHENTLSG